MIRLSNASRLRLPERLAYTALRVTVAGTIACSASSGEPSEPVDASADRHAEASSDACAPIEAAVDAPSDGPFSDACATGQQLPCVAVNQCASCPAYVCSPLDCPAAAGCEPII